MALSKKLTRYAPIVIDSNFRFLLSEENQRCLQTIGKAGALIDKLWHAQSWRYGLELSEKISEHYHYTSDVWKYFEVNKGPWCQLDGDCFLPEEFRQSLPFPIPNEAPTGTYYFPTSSFRFSIG